jgi:hypothetical protein
MRIDCAIAGSGSYATIPAAVPCPINVRRLIFIPSSLVRMARPSLVRMARPSLVRMARRWPCYRL